MKTIWIITFVIAFGFTAKAGPLEGEIKNFSDALKSSSAAKPGTDPMIAERMSEMSAQLVSSALAPGGDTQLDAMVRQIMATNSDDAVQKTGKALLDDLEARKKAKMDAVKAQVDAVLAKAPDILIKAQKTEELDGLLGDLQKVQASSGNGYDPDSPSQVNRVNTAYQFVAQWQDYLSARNSGNIQAAQETLRNLSNSNRQGESTLVPRSEILARSVELAGATKSTAPGASGTAGTNKTPEIDSASIINGIKTLDDMVPALKSLKAAAIYPNSPTTESQILSQFIELYANCQNGLPVSIDINNANYSYNGNPQPELDRVKAMLLMYLLPRFIGSNASAPNPNESVNDYLDRAIDETASKQDWVSLQRIIEAKMTISKSQNQSSGSRSFLAGLNQEIAGQYAQAVTSYQSALNMPDDTLPAKVIGDRLAALKKDHSAEFEQASKSSLNAPPPAYANPYALRAAMGFPVPGYPYPGNKMPNPAAALGTNTAPVAPTLPPASTNLIPAPAAPATK